jgi:putative transposase
MPKRNFILATGETYHIFNRSIANESIFSNQRYLNKVFEIVDYYRFPQSIRLSKYKTLPTSFKMEYLDNMKKKDPLIEIYAFAIMPNHFHFLLKQNIDKGIISFISNFQNSYAKYFNIKNERNGSLFQKPFNGKRIENDNQLLHVSRYIHLNPVTSYLVEFKDLEAYPYTSLVSYKNSQYSFLKPEIILLHFKSFKEYSLFLQDQVDYQRTLKLIKDFLFK